MIWCCHFNNTVNERRVPGPYAVSSDERAVRHAQASVKHASGSLQWQRDENNPQGATTIIHGTPKRSATMPKREEKKVLVNGICTCPPSARAANSRSASASLGTVSDSEKPWKFGRPWPCAYSRRASSPSPSCWPGADQP